MEYIDENINPVDFEKIKDVGFSHNSDIIFCSVGNYVYFLAHGEPGLDAFVLYSHLQFTSRIQGTERIKAYNSYLQQGLSMGEKKIKAAKSFLCKTGYISYVRTKPNSEKNKLGNVFIEIIHPDRTGPTAPEIEKAVDFDKVKNIAIETYGDIIFCTVGTYKRFLSSGNKGIESYLVYSHLQFTSRMQCTLRVKANNNYLQTGLHFGEKKLERAKSFLHRENLIKYHRSNPRPGCNRFGEVYIEILHFWSNQAVVQKIEIQTSTNISSTAEIAPVQKATTAISAPVERSTGAISTGVETYGSSSESQMLEFLNSNTLKNKLIHPVPDQNINNQSEYLAMELAALFYDEFNKRMEKYSKYRVKASVYEISKMSSFLLEFENVPDNFPGLFKETLTEYFNESYWFKHDKKSGKLCIGLSNFITHWHEIATNVFSKQTLNKSNIKKEKDENTKNQEKAIIFAEEKAFKTLLSEIPKSVLEEVKSHKHYTLFHDSYLRTKIIETFGKRFSELVNQAMKTSNNQSNFEKEIV